MKLLTKNTFVVAALLIVAGFGLYQFTPSPSEEVKPAIIGTIGAQLSGSNQNSLVSSLSYKAEPRNFPSANLDRMPKTSNTQWSEKILSRAEIKAHSRFWMLAYTEAEKTWLDQYGYPSLDQEAKLSAASLEELVTLTMSGDLNAKVHLGIRYSLIALGNGDEVAFRQGMGNLMGAIIDGGPYQAAKTMAFFAEISKNRATFGELNAAQKKGLEERLLQTYDLARGISIAHGDYAAYQLGRDVSDDPRIKFDLPPQKKDATFESAMDTLSKLNATRNTRGLPPFSFIPRPPKPFVAEETPTQSVTVYMK